MGLKCEYCGGALTGQERSCPNCGAAVPALAASAAGSDKVPKTIAELKTFAQKHNLPLQKMRVFLGEDYRGAKAFGIYQESADSFVVYKNKSDGSRTVRYRGPDEAHAVKELYLKMRDMVRQQSAFQSSVRSGSGRKPASRSSVSRSSSRGSWLAGLPLWAKWGIVIAIVLILYVAIFCKTKRRGYYHYNNDYYYQQNGSWYVYEDDDWIPYVIDGEFADSYEDYYESDSYSYGYGVPDFSQSGYYVEPAQDNYDNGSEDWDWDWDDDDWDWDDDGWDWDDDWDDIGDWDSDW